LLLGSAARDSALQGFFQALLRSAIGSGEISAAAHLPSSFVFPWFLIRLPFVVLCFGPIDLSRLGSRIVFAHLCCSAFRRKMRKVRPFFSRLLIPAFLIFLQPTPKE
jgi:hypothetical protein